MAIGNGTGGGPRLPNSGSGAGGRYGYGYGYGYGQAARGYGYGGTYGQNQQGEEDLIGGKTIKDYLIALKERWWLVLLVAVTIFTVAVLYVHNLPRTYSAQATLEIPRFDAMPIQTGVRDPSEIRGLEDFRTRVNALRSDELIRLVEQRLQGEELLSFMRPYEDQFRLTGPLTPFELLARNVRINEIRQSFNVAVQFTHRNPQMAARIANLFSREFVDLQFNLALRDSFRAVDELTQKVEESRAEVNRLRNELNEYRSQYSMVAIREEENVFLSQLAQLSSNETVQQSELSQLANRRALIDEFEEEGRPLWELPFIGDSPQVSELVKRLSDFQIIISTLSERYRPRHPKMIEAQQNIDSTRRELATAINTAKLAVINQYRLARSNLEETRRQIQEQNEKLLNLETIRVDYNRLRDEFEVARLSAMEFDRARTQSEAATALKSPGVKITSAAFPPPRPSGPNFTIYYAMGLFGGIGAGLGLVFFLAFLDDRVKSVSDIERGIGVPLLTVVPVMGKHMTDSEKSQVSINRLDHFVAETFRALESTLKLNDTSRNARKFVVTSSLPGEGKSLVSSNLALTLANHGHKTLLIDCDLRLPNIARSMELEIEKGLISYLQGDTDLEESIIENFSPNLDILPTETKASNPTQILTGSTFEELLTYLGTQYDKIIIDSPPIGAVSDSLNLLPITDGVIYVVRFNSVKRRFVQSNLRKIAESNRPIFGAVMNAVSHRMATLYYSEYYNREYTSYYESEEVGEEVKVPLKEKPVKEI